ncbi:hypothetical protein P7M08_24865, partial [Vibrio parahaemolyticus]|nr:hypothetical protein [Vibrio parahaemolyticus]
ELVDDRRNTLMRWLLQAEVGDEAVDVVAAAEEDEGEDAVNCLRSSENQGQDPWVVRRRGQLLLVLLKMLLMKISGGSLNTFNQKSRNLLQCSSLILTMQVQSLQLRQFKSWKYCQLWTLKHH